MKVLSKKWLCVGALALSAFQVHAYSHLDSDKFLKINVGENASKKFDINPAFNIAHGLAPVDQHQKISVLEPFNGQFRILGSKEYLNDDQAKFSPIDFAVTRGLFTEPAIARQISINQYDRFLNWKMAKPPIPAHYATQLVSNMHIIPANPEIAKQIKKVQRGDLVRLTGDLVQVNDKDLVWKSALDWNGVGDGACKLIRVDSIQWLEKQNI